MKVFSEKKSSKLIQFLQPIAEEEGEIGDEDKVEEGPSNHDRYGDNCIIIFLRISSADPIKPIRAMAAPMICLVHINKGVD